MSLDPAHVLVLTAIMSTTVGGLLIFTSLQNRNHVSLLVWGSADLVGAAAAVLLLLRSVRPDSLPVIDRAPRLENAWFAFGHGHIGMCSAATTGREIANLVAGRAPEIDLAPFRATRF